MHMPGKEKTKTWQDMSQLTINPDALTQVRLPMKKAFFLLGSLE